MPAHRFFLPARPSPAPGPWVIGGEEARHAARVKRLDLGEPVEVLDGMGSIASGAVTAIDKEYDGWVVRVNIETVRRIEPIRPAVVVLCPAPKGDRLPQLIEGLSQVGAAAWRPLHAERTVAEPAAARLDRLERIAQESAKQCGRAWTLRIEQSITFTTALALPSLVMADAGSGPFTPPNSAEIHLLIGPEGGWSDAERAAARAAGAAPASFGPHVMRVETAAVVAAASVLAAG
ncbi:MAG: 16S rRNA (uracil(1498)-N(3))-methyltransferase [Phycisphaerales bacterium]|nr:16S rRNA (uracil(1498)-N(3))-methyltransferase [Phycisphaerales bacterium]